MAAFVTLGAWTGAIHHARTFIDSSSPSLSLKRATRKRPRWQMVAEKQVKSKEQEQQEAPAAEIVVDDNIGGFCSINPKTGRREELGLREKEQLFLDTVQSYYDDGKSPLSNDEFDELKEELVWQGSEVVTLSRDEFAFLDAAKAFEKGKPSMSDEEFDKLKVRLKRQGSIVALQRGPRCSIRRQITFSDVIPDTKRMVVLYTPAFILIGLAWLSAAYEFTPLRHVDPVLSLILGSPIMYFGSRIVTGIILQDPQIYVGDCPNCNKRLNVYFGGVLNIEGFTKEADIKCEKCKAGLKVEKETGRMILVSE